MTFHDDRCPKCNRRVLGHGIKNQSEVIDTEPSLMNSTKTCVCGAHLRYELDTYDPIVKGCTLWEEVSA